MSPLPSVAARLGVPVPGRGYWARVAAGQEPHRPKFPKRESQYGDGSALAFPPVPDEPPAPEAGALPAQESVLQG